MIRVLAPSTPGTIRVAVPLWVLDAILKAIDLNGFIVNTGGPPIGALKLVGIDRSADVEGAVVVVAAADDLPESYRESFLSPWERDCWPRQNRVLLPGERPARA